MRRGATDCTAVAGTCKHVVAFWGWLERRSSSKSVTSATCYWKKARLSNVNIETKKADLTALNKTPSQSDNSASFCGNQFQEAVLSRAPSGQTGLIFSHFGNQTNPAEEIGVDNLLRSFAMCCKRVPTCDEFLDYCRLRMTSELCAVVRRETVTQFKSPLWHAVRFARVIASKGYGAAHSSLSSVNTFMSVTSASKLKDTAAMERGRRLEPKVLLEVEKKCRTH